MLTDMSDGFQVAVAVMAGAAALMIQYITDLRASKDETLRQECRIEEKEANRSLVEPDCSRSSYLNQRQIESHHAIVTRQARQPTGRHRWRCGQGF